MLHSNHKSAVLFLVCTLFFTLIACKSTKTSGTKKLPGTWQKEAIAVDGSNKDWPSPYPTYDEDAMIGYAISNDKNNLYISVETGDLATQLKILRGGLTVWIDKTGANNKLTAINFPIPQEEKYPLQLHANSPDKQRLELEDKVSAALLNASEYSLQGFKSCNLQYPIKENDTCGIIVRIAVDADNELVWEAVIPFKTFYPKHTIDARDKGKPMSICIETTCLKKPAGGSQISGSRVNDIRSVGMRPGLSVGGMGLGMNVGRGRPRGGAAPQYGNNIAEPLYRSTVTWKKFGIAFVN